MTLTTHSHTKQSLYSLIFLFLFLIIKLFFGGMMVFLDPPDRAFFKEFWFLTLDWQVPSSGGRQSSQCPVWTAEASWGIYLWHLLAFRLKPQGGSNLQSLNACGSSQSCSLCQADLRPASAKRDRLALSEPNAENSGAQRGPSYPRGQTQLSCMKKRMLLCEYSVNIILLCEEVMFHSRIKRK